MLHASDWRGTLESCRRVLSRDPEHLGALETMAQALWCGGLYDEVIRVTSRMLLLNPHEPGYRFTRGMAHLSRGELVQASADFRMALAQSKDPKFREQVARALDAVAGWQGNLGAAASFGLDGAPRSPRVH